jgi:predicted DNA binding protein
MDDTTPPTVTPAEVLSVFDDGPPGEPLTSVDVATALDCTRRTAYNKLQALESAGDLRTKKIGARGRVWWRVPTTPAVPPRDDHEDPATHVVEAQFSSVALAAPFAEVTTSADQTFDVAQDLPLPDGRRLQYYTVTGIGPRAFTAAFESLPSVESVRLLSTVGDVSRMEVLVARHSVTEVLREYDGHIEQVTVRDGEYRLTAALPATTDVADVTVAMKDVYPDVVLVGTRSAPVARDFWSVVATTLTDRQRTVLRLAYHAGYFESPRQSTGEALADRLGITRQTFNYHLRQAEHAVFERLFEKVSVDESDP